MCYYRKVNIYESQENSKQDVVKIKDDIIEDKIVEIEKIRMEMDQKVQVKQSEI
jgi:hypothetical protein